MMVYLKIRRSKSQIRATGLRYATPIVITKTAKYGDVLSERVISIKKPILITGEPDSGKTRWLNRLHKHAMEIWGFKSKSEPLWLEARQPVVEWFKAPAVKIWWRQQQKTRPEAERQTWTSLNHKERSQVLVDYCKDTGAVVFLDDAHKLGGSALTLAKQCIAAARVWVVAAYREPHIPAQLLETMENTSTQRFELYFFPKAQRVYRTDKPVFAETPPN